MKTALMILLIIVSSSLGDILISRGMKQVGEVNTLKVRELLSIARRTLTNFNFLGGIMGMAIAFFSLLAVLTWADLSLVSPATSLGYVVNTIGAKFFLNEKIDRGRWIGTALVCLGAAML